MSVETATQIGALEILRKMKKGLQLAGSAPDKIEKYIKCVYFTNPYNDPLATEQKPALNKTKLPAVVVNSTAGAQNLTINVTTGKKWVIKKLMIGNAAGVANAVQAKYVTFDGFRVFDWENDTALTYYSIAADNEIVLIGVNSTLYQCTTSTDLRLGDSAFLTRNITVNVVNGGDSMCFLRMWVDEYDLNVSETSSSDV